MITYLKNDLLKGVRSFLYTAIGPPGAWLDTPDYSKSVAI